MMENESGSGDERRQPGRIRNILFSPLVPNHEHDHEGHHVHAAPAPADRPEGLEHLVAVAREAFTALRPGGLLLMEHGYRQGDALKVCLESHSWENVLVHKDLAGLDRLISARRPAS